LYSAIAAIKGLLQMICKNRRSFFLVSVIFLVMLACGPVATSSVPEIPTLIPTDVSLPTAASTKAIATLTPTSEPIGFDSALASVSYTLPPVIQNVTENSAVVFFELSNPADGLIVYSPTSDPSRQTIIQIDQLSARHQVVIPNLEPDTEYKVSVGMKSTVPNLLQSPGYRGESWDSVRVKTLRNETPVRGAIIGDGGFGSETTFRLANEMAANDLDFVLYAGDIVYNIGDDIDPYEAFALKYYLPLAPLLKTIPVYPAVGNHDVEPAARVENVPFYYTAFPPFPDPRFAPSDHEGRNKWYAFSYADIQFLSLDSQVFYNEEGEEIQTTWIQERLADTRFTNSIPFFHIPPFNSGNHTFDGLPVRDNWIPLFEGSNVPLVISGHDHNYQHLQVNGISYLISGGASEVLYDQQVLLPESVYFARRTHYVLMEIYPDRIDLRAIALGGETIDQFTVLLR
jgi:hypothetical protein